MSTSSVVRTPARAIWPTEEEASTIYIISKDTPILQTQLLTLDDDKVWDQEKRLKSARGSFESELAKVVQARDIVLLRSALTAQKKDLTKADLNGAFLVACEEAADLDAVRLLVDAGADINTTLEDCDTALHIACYTRNEGLAEFLIGAGIDVHSRGRLGRTPLHVTAAVEFPLGANLLLQSGADVDPKDDSGWTPLYQSCCSSSLEAQKVLISGGADIHCVDDGGWTPLHEAASWGNIDNAAIMLAAHAKIDLSSTPQGFTPLHVAVLYDKKDMVHYLLESGSDPHHRTSTGFTPLQLAVLADSRPIVLEILQWSTECIGQKTADGSTAIHIAAGNGLEDVVDLLLTYGADITLRDGDGLTPPDVAAKFGHHSITRMFDTETPYTSQSWLLCSTCKQAGILSLLERKKGMQRVPLGTYDSVRQRIDCPFCSMILNMLPKDASKCVLTDGIPSEIAILRKGAAVPRLEVQFDGTCHGYIQEDDGIDLAEVVGSISLEEKYLAEPEIDHPLIRSWISECEEVHDVTPLSATDPASQRAVHDILLIDVEGQCVVSGNVEQRYVALSYVWGRVPGFQATKQTELAFKVQGFLRTVELPKVIRDAMDFVENLGEQYIWIDSLCIIQDEPAHRNLQLAQMDVIYSRAWLTLVALSAFDADSGLAGLHKDSRASARSVQYIDDKRLISKPPEFDTIFNKSKYSSRAWTLQESILSPRCLYVTKNQIYYSCHGTLRTEDRQSVAAEGRRALQSVNWFTDALIEAQQPLSPMLVAEDWMHHFRTYAQLVRHCTSRKLSDPRDVLNATLGPLMVLSPYLGPFSLAGLPDLYLDHALLWAPAGTGVEARNKHFPSWSWAGWDCHCEYFVKPVFLGSTSDPIPLISAIERLETYWQTAPRVIDRKHTQRGAIYDDTVQSWPLNPISEPSTAIQVLSFDTEIVHRNHLDIVKQRPRVRMMIKPEPTVTLFDLKQKAHCGLLYTDWDSLDEMMAAEHSGWNYSFMLLSRTHAPPLSQEFFFNTDVYERRPWCLLNIMLVKHLHNPITGVIEDVPLEGYPAPDRSVTQKFERVAIGQIHSDAWEATGPVVCHIALF